MFYACVQRFDGMDEKFLDRKLNKAKKTKLLPTKQASVSHTAVFLLCCCTYGRRDDAESDIASWALLDWTWTGFDE